jgi:hypothetical protein
MTEEIVGSKMKPNNGYGANGFTGAASLLPGEKVKRNSIAQGIVAADPVTAGAGDWQTRPVSTEQKVPTAFGHKNPNADPAKIPAGNVRRSKTDNVGRPVGR